MNIKPRIGKSLKTEKDGSIIAQYSASISITEIDSIKEAEKVVEVMLTSISKVSPMAKATLDVFMEETVTA